MQSVIHAHIAVCVLCIVTRVFFESDSYSVTEDDGTVTVCVRRVGETAEALSIQVSTNNLIPVDARGKF